ncbi:hypothetical protein DPEC_G00338370 [Dallia pectoralis]|uniref:Uncharacterized protein n=1 Tax=Dallia pectoralis TaxID=75939 RepID=A0ACC2F4J6_DALPE|nr:hypothetical protein DPEC_G00338370 [Dallia pectoralis]
MIEKNEAGESARRGGETGFLTYHVACSYLLFLLFSGVCTRLVSPSLFPTSLPRNFTPTPNLTGRERKVVSGCGGKRKGEDRRGEMVRRQLRVCWPRD